MSLGPYAYYILTSYLVSFVVVGILIVWIALDYRGLTRRLRELDRRGIARRSGRSATDIR